MSLSKEGPFSLSSKDSSGFNTQGHQIVKLRGKGLPESKISPYPTVEIYREEIDGRFWFPTYAYADEEILLGSGGVVKIRLRVRFSEFEKVTRK